jgi:LEA14-like dessication related protein
MSKQFWGFLVVGLVMVGLGVAAIWSGTKKQHLDLTGKVIKVRSVAVDDKSTLVVVDFRVTNPSAIPLVLREVSLKMERYKEDPLDGLKVSKSDVDTMFQIFPRIGVKYSDVLAQGETITPGKTIDRMAEATFETTEPVVEYRKAMVLHFEDVDGAGFDIAEVK